MTAQPTNVPAEGAVYWDAALETQTRAAWEAMKLELLKAHLQHAYNGSPYYRASFDAVGVHPGQVGSLDDLRRFPFIDKHALRDRQLAVPPLGDLVAVPERDMLIIKGVNIFPSDVEALVRGDDRHTGEYRLVVERFEHLDQLTVELERAHGPSEPDDDVAARFGLRLKALTGVSARVAVLPAGSLPRATHKAKRIEDRRASLWT